MISAFDFSGLRAVVYKEVRHILREPTTLAYIVLLPVIELLIYGYAINLHVEHVATVYYNRDTGRTSAELVRVLHASRAFRVIGSVGSEEGLRHALVAGTAHVAFEIPPGFSNDVRRGDTAPVQMFIDGSDSTIAQAAYGEAREAAFALTARYDPFASDLAVDIKRHMLFNPQLRTPNFLIPGLIGAIMQNMTMILTALSIVRERERGTLDQMRQMSIGPGAVILGTVIPYGVIGFVDLALVLVTMRAVFAVPIAGSVAALLGLSIAFLMGGLGLGLLISTIARSQLQAMIMAVFFILPSVLLSGMIFEIELMPAPARVVAYALPLTYFLQILRGIIIRGAGIGDLWIPALAVCLFGFGSMVLASLRFAATSS